MNILRNKVLMLITFIHTFCRFAREHADSVTPKLQTFSMDTQVSAKQLMIDNFIMIPDDQNTIKYSSDVPVVSHVVYFILCRF